MKKALKRHIPQALQVIAWGPTRLFLNYFVHFKVEGLEHLEGVRGPVIFAANHISELDPILVRAALPCFSPFAPLFYVSRKNYLLSIKGLRKYLYGGFFFKFWGAYPAETGLKSYEESLFRHIQLLQEGNSICIFPEGRITKNGELGEIHGGVAYLAETTNTPIIPVNITGTYKITSTDFKGRTREATVTFFPKVSISIEERDAEHYREAAAMVMKEPVQSSNKIFV